MIVSRQNRDKLPNSLAHSVSNTAPGSMSGALITLALATMPLASPAHAESYVEKIGGQGGSQFEALCNSDENLVGFDIKIADDIDAIRPICAVALAPAQIAQPRSAGPWRGGTGGQPRRLACPASTPILIGLFVAAEGVSTLVVTQLQLFCGLAVQGQTVASLPSSVAEGPWLRGSSFSGLMGRMTTCPPGEVAVGIHGNSGIWLDAVGLICAPPRVRRTDNGKPVARVNASTEPKRPGSLCDAARDARARNSPAAARLEAQCSAWQATVPPPIINRLLDDDIAGRAAVLIKGDTLFAAARELLASDAERQGFDIGVKASFGQTQYGPNKQALHDTLASAEQRGFRTAVSLALDLNRHKALADVGAEIARTSENLLAARTAEPDVRFWLGFDIATGIFGDRNLGAQGNTQSGPGSLGIRNGLSPAAQRGFNAAMALHLAVSGR